MLFKRGKHSDNDAILLLKYVLLSLLIIILPVALFLTGFSWYATLQIYVTNNPDLVESPLFLKNCLIFGIVGIMTFLVYFLLFLLVDFNLKRVTYRWKKIILIVAILGATLIFLLFEIFSIIFIDYRYSWQLSLVLIFWPLLYVLLIVLLLVNYFEFYSEQKSLTLNKVANSDKERDLILKSHTETIF